MALDSRAIVSLAETKNYLSPRVEPFDTSQDSLLESMINSATAVIERYCETYFVEYVVGTPEKPEIHDGTGTAEVETSYWPVRSITQIVYTPYAGGGPYNVLSGDYYLYPSSGIIRLRPDSSTVSSFGTSPQSIEIAYKAGYCADTASVPADVGLAAKHLIQVWYRDRGGDLTSERLGDYSWQRSPAWRKASDLHEQVKFLLSPYKQVRPR